MFSCIVVMTKAVAMLHLFVCSFILPVFTHSLIRSFICSFVHLSICICIVCLPIYVSHMQSSNSFLYEILLWHKVY